jgi:hypothetical protein
MDKPTLGGLLVKNARLEADVADLRDLSADLRARLVRLEAGLAAARDGLEQLRLKLDHERQYTSRGFLEPGAALEPGVSNPAPRAAPITTFSSG